MHTAHGDFGILQLVYRISRSMSGMSHRNIITEAPMIATAISAFVLLAAVQCLLVVHVADKLTPGASDESTATGGTPQFA